MRVEVVAIGTELLLGQIVDTNRGWLGQALAEAGVTVHYGQTVGDNKERMVLAMRTALARSDGVIVCGGLGPTQDDITREAIAEVMNVDLVVDQVIVERIRGFFGDRGRSMPENNIRQAEVPVGADVIEQAMGTAPGLICPIGQKVIYAVPGVPYEMSEMFERGILPDLRRRMAEAGEIAVIRSRVLRTWGSSESGLSEVLADRITALDGAAATAGPDEPVTTIAFLASGIEGIKVRLTTRARDEVAATGALDAEEALARSAITGSLGDIIFGTDDESMEVAVAALLSARDLTLAIAESLTGGLIASRLVDVPGASTWFRGGVVSYASDVKYSVLGVPEGPVVSEDAAGAMASRVAGLLKADVGLGITGVAGPDPQEDVVPGTVHVGVHFAGDPTPSTSTFRLPGDRQRVRQYASISALDILRRRLLSP